MKDPEHLRLLLAPRKPLRGLENRVSLCRQSSERSPSGRMCVPEGTWLDGERRPDFSSHSPGPSAALQGAVYTLCRDAASLRVQAEPCPGGVSLFNPSGIS